MHEVLVNRLGGLSLPRKSVVRLTDRPDMTLDVYRGRKTTIQQYNSGMSSAAVVIGPLRFKVYNMLCFSVIFTKEIFVSSSLLFESKTQSFFTSFCKYNPMSHMMKEQSSLFQTVSLKTVLLRLKHSSIIVATDSLTEML